MRMMISTSLLLIVLLWAPELQAQKWETPVILGYGQIIDYPETAVRPDPGKQYHLLFHIKSDKLRENVNAGLWKIARVINLLGKAGVPQDQIKIVAVISGPATPIVLTDAAYKRREKATNPHLELMKLLSEYGVQIHVCGQAAAERDIDPISDLNAYTRLTQSALIDVATYQMEGYIMMPS